MNVPVSFFNITDTHNHLYIYVCKNNIIDKINSIGKGQLGYSNDWVFMIPVAVIHATVVILNTHSFINRGRDNMFTAANDKRPHQH